MTDWDPADASGFDQLLEYRQRLLERLASQPDEAARLLARLPEPDWQARTLPSGHTPHQELAHVRDLELLAFQPRVRRILAEPGPQLEPFPNHRWADYRYQASEPPAHIAAEWTGARRELVRVLRALPDEFWARQGFHPPTGHRTAQWWVEHLYGHAADHLRAIVAVLPA